MDDIGRDVYEGRGPNGEDVRLYTRDGIDLPSVTTILKTRDEDMSNLYKWQEKHDGEGDNAYHEHWFWYARHRGTLAHFHALKTMDPSLEWTSDEAGSVYEIYEQDDDEVEDASPREVLYSVVKYLGEVETWGEFYDVYPPYQPNEFYREALEDRLQRDIDYFVEQFERICGKLGLAPDSAVEVERYVFDQEFGYAGQCDLLLEYPDGSVAMADLKTKKGAFTKEKLQGAAYAKAVERAPDIPIDSVDRTEVWCIHPDTGKFAIFCPPGDSHGQPSQYHSSKYWNRGYDDLWGEFRDLAENYEYDEPEDD